MILEELGVMSVVVRIRVIAFAITVLTLAGSGCTKSERPAPQAPPSQTTGAPTTIAEPPPITRPSCDVAVPASWQAAMDGSAVDTRRLATVPLAVSRAGDVVAVRDNGDTRDVLLIGAGKSVKEIYAVPDPNRNNVGFAAIDDRWIVVGVDRIPRHSNGVLPGLIQIDVIDRQGGALRIVTRQSEDDYTNGRNALDSVALYRDKVYWITRATYAGTTGTVNSYDLGTGAVAQVASGIVRDLRATAAGLAWAGDGPRAEVKIPGSLPHPVARAIGQDQVTLATDGTAYAWVTGLDQGGTGVAWWTPGSGLVRVTGKAVPSVAKYLPPVYVVGPYVLLGTGREGVTTQNTLATVVDTRSGAVTHLTDMIAGADGGIIGLYLRPGTSKSAAGVVRSEALPQLSC